MFIPLGDDVQNRNLPLVGTFLLMSNLLVFAYEYRLFMDAAETRSDVAVHRFVMDWGLVPELLEEGEIHGLFTYMFLHGDLMHFIGNMIVLWAFVRTLENALGSFSFLGMYLIWGVISGICHAVMTTKPDLPMIGASGAISGMVGAYLVGFGFRTNIKTLVWIVYPRTYQIPALAYIGMWLCTQLMGVADEARGQSAGVAWWAHLGGFGAGAFCMMMCRGKTQQKLVMNEEGELQFVAAEAASVRRAVVAPAPLGAVHALDACPHCHTPFGQDDRISGSLLQCRNPDCKRLTYLG